MEPPAGGAGAASFEYPIASTVVLPITKYPDETIDGPEPYIGANIVLKGAQPQKLDWQGIFSFVLYWHEAQDVSIAEKYQDGLRAYLDAVHKEPYFVNYGVILYTDSTTLPRLEKLFPSNDYPKLILALVSWPYYTSFHRVKKGIINRNLFRVIRFHAVEYFQNSFVLVRDADTIFLQDYTYQDVANWETEFIEKYLKPSQDTKKIVVGLSVHYLKGWHFNHAYPIPIQNNTRKYRSKIRVSNNKKPQYRYTYYKNFADYFKWQWGITPPYGVLASFMNFITSGGQLGRMWSQCISFLVRRYYLLQPVSQSNRYANSRISNEYANSTFHSIPIGKDERMIIFTILLKYFPLCKFFNVENIFPNSLTFLDPKEQTILFHSENPNEYPITQKELETMLSPIYMKNMSNNYRNQHLKIYQPYHNPRGFDDFMQEEWNTFFKTKYIPYLVNSYSKYPKEENFFQAFQENLAHKTGEHFNGKIYQTRKKGGALKRLTRRLK